MIRAEQGMHETAREAAREAFAGMGEGGRRHHENGGENAEAFHASGYYE
jgi:hypothetical protein